MRTQRAADVAKFEQSLQTEKVKDEKGIYQGYSLTTYILFFFTFSIMGWIWEVALHYVQTGVLVNRGVLSGPWLPIYGNGGVLLLILCKKIFHKPIVTFFVTMTIASIIEYATSWVLEIKNGVRWWDYSGYFMNINGRICLEGAVIFGIGGCLVIYIAAPSLANIYKKIGTRFKIVICIVLAVFYLTDQIYSFEHPNMGKGVTVHKKIAIEDN